MRRLTRPPLPTHLAVGMLKRKRKLASLPAQNELQIEAQIQKKWNVARQTRWGRELLQALQKMAGEGWRCMYCLDSAGTDIEHFWPKSRFPRRMFNWRNLLLCCTGCGRLKNTQFPMLGKRPLLLDPSKEEPWLTLDFNPQTGNLAARFDPNILAWSPKGVETVRVLHLDRREDLAGRYKKNWQKLQAKVIEQNQTNALSSAEFVRQLRELDEYDLLAWVVFGVGAQEACFVQLRSNQAATWQLLYETQSQSRALARDVTPQK